MLNINLILYSWTLSICQTYDEKSPAGPNGRDYSKVREPKAQMMISRVKRSVKKSNSLGSPASLSDAAKPGTGGTPI